MSQHSIPSSRFCSTAAAILVIAISQVGPAKASATPVISAGNIPHSGVSPGGVDMATGERLMMMLFLSGDLVIQGPMPVVFGRYYASMLAREGLA